MKIHLHTIGCRLNQAEIETMARQLAAGGHAIAPTRPRPIRSSSTPAP
jgi:tRNA A37 methylthiotransferase MiaB